MKKAEQKNYAYTYKPFYSSNKDPEVLLKEGIPARLEAIKSLQSQGSLPPLQWLPELSMSSKDHTIDMGAKGLCGHTGSDKSSPD